MPPAIDLTGKKFGRLTAIEKVGRTKHRAAIWLCRCECGVEKNVISSDLKKGHTKSCGCLSVEMFIDRKTKHGLAYHILYKTWSSILSRCNNKNDTCFKYYGERGINVCTEWSDIKSFIKWAELNGYKKGLEIDRIDNDGDYCPENCRFVTPKENINNARLLKVSNTSGYRGVCFVNERGKYKAQIGGTDAVFNGKPNKHIGYYNTPEEAAEAIDRFIIDHNLPYRKLQILKRP